VCDTKYGCRTGQSEGIQSIDFSEIFVVLGACSEGRFWARQKSLFALLRRVARAGFGIFGMAPDAGGVWFVANA